MVKLLAPHILASLFILVALFLVGKTFFNVIFSWRNNKLQLSSTESSNAHTIELVRPLAFIKLFASCLTVSFFPQYLMGVTLASHMPAAFSSVIFVVYQLFFIIMIIPGGYIVEFKNLKKVLIITTFIECLVLFSFAFTTNFWEILLLQIIFGCIVPLSSAAEYAYIFNFSSDANRTYSLALYSNSIKGAMVAGIILGGIFASYFNNIRTVFVIASGIVFFALLYAIIFIPQARARNIEIANTRIEQVGFKFVLQKIPGTLKNINFFKVISCVGFPVGLLTEGIVYFSLPLILSNHHISPTHIGQLLVLFAMGFFMTNKYVAKQADKLKAERLCLFLGLLGITAGLLLIACLDLDKFLGWSQSYLGFSLFILGLISLGLFRGFLISPAASYISKSPVSLTIGKNVALSVYRLFEVLGKIIGPVLIVQLLIYLHYSSFAFIIASILFLLFTIIMLPFAREAN